MKLFRLFCLSAFLPFCLSSCDHPYLAYLFDEPVPVEQDTVCTTYTPIDTPAFITSMMIMDDWHDYIVLNVYPHADTIYEGEDIQFALDSMVKLRLPQYESSTYVNDDNRLLQCVIVKGTNDKSLLLGKIWIRYFGARYYFACESQSMVVFGAMNETEFNDNLVKLPSFRMVNWMYMHLDSLSQNNSMAIALDTSNCKGGWYWFDTRFNDYDPPQVFLDYADAAGWDDVLSNVGETIVVEGRASDAEIMYYLNLGYMVKVID